MKALLAITLSAALVGCGGSGPEPNKPQPVHEYHVESQTK